MNRRIKKKVDKRLHSGIMTKLDENKRKFYPTAKTYREIKNERKAFRETMIHCRHVASKLIDYSHQLCNSRRLRKAWKREFIN
jgi:hypothetical protein